MASDPTYNGDIQASTLDDFVRDIAYDNFFVETAYEQHMRAIGAVDPFDGGVLMREPFIMGSPKSGPASPGTNFNITHQQQLADIAFNIRLYTSRDMLEQFSLSVQNRGPNARISLKELYYRNAIASLSTNVEVDAYWHGQAAIAGQIASNRTTATNGMAEALNDGLNNSWQGDRFVNYGSQVRNGAVSSTLNSIPFFFGNSDGSAGSISVRALIQFLIRARKFNKGITPELTITTPNGWGYILSALQTQQQFTTEWSMKKADMLDTVPDAQGIAFLGTVFYDDILTPGAAWGTDFPTNYITTSNSTALTGGATSNFTSSSTATGVNSPSQLPASTGIVVGETIWALTGRAWKMRPPEAEEFLFGVRENQVYNNNTNDAYLVNLGMTIYSMTPRRSMQGYGFNG